MSTERRPVAFNKFGGLRLDLPLDEIGGEQAQYLRDVDWDGNTGRLRPRDGFAKLKATDATGPYKALFPHSNLRLLATKRVKSSEVKIVAIDKDGEEKTSHSWPETAATFCATRFGTPSASYTYCRANLSSAKVVRFDGTSFTEPTCSVDGATGKEMPRGKFMAAWMAGGERLVVANTGATGGPGGAASSNSHVWFSEAEGKAEAYESTAYVQVSVGDGEEITGLAEYGGAIYVFKETKFFRFYGIDTDEEGRPVFRFNEESLGEGARMKRPVVESLAESSDQLVCVGPDGIYFCTSDGVYVTRGAGATKISQALRPLEEVSPFDGPMAEFLNGETEVFRWPATGIACLGTRLIVRRYEFMFVLDLPTGEWTCWKMPAVSMAIWTGLTGGGAESTKGEPSTAVDNPATGTRAWSDLDKALEPVNEGATADLTAPGEVTHYLQFGEFDFSAVPEGAIIAGLALSVGRRAFQSSPSSIPAVIDSQVSLGRAGEVVGVNKASSVPWLVDGFFFRVDSFGGVEDLWGTTWTVAQLAELEVFISATTFSHFFGSNIAEIAGVWVQVSFFTPEAASGVRPRLYCTQGKSVFVTTPGAEEEAETREAEWQSGFYDLGSRDEKELVGARAFGAGTIDAQSFSDFDDQSSPSEGQFAFPASGNRSVLDDNALTDSGVMFSHKLKLEPGSRIQSLDRYLRETRTPETKGR